MKMGKRTEVSQKLPIPEKQLALPEPARKFTEEELEKFDVMNPEEERDFDKRAEVLLGETADQRSQSLREFREKLELVEDFEPKLDSDRFLLRFLRARKFDVDKAYKLLCNFYNVRVQNPKKYVPIGMGPRDFKHLYDLDCCILLKHRNPLDGTVVVLCRFGKWKPSTGYGPLDTYTPAVYGGELIMDQPEVQLNGFTFIIDLQGLEYSWILKYFTPEYLTKMVGFAQESYPIRIKKIHIVNQSYLWNVGYAIGKHFVPLKLRERYHLHGRDLSSLHRHIAREILPAELGGLRGPLDLWFVDALLQLHDRIVEDSHYGYAV